MHIKLVNCVNSLSYVMNNWDRCVGSNQECSKFFLMYSCTGIGLLCTFIINLIRHYKSNVSMGR